MQWDAQDIVTIVSLSTTILGVFVALINGVIKYNLKPYDMKLEEIDEKFIDYDKKFDTVGKQFIELERKNHSMEKDFDNRITANQKEIMEKMGQILNMIQDMKLEKEKDNLQKEKEAGHLQTSLVKDYVTNEKFDKAIDLIRADLKELPCKVTGKKCGE